LQRTIVKRHETNEIRTPIRYLEFSVRIMLTPIVIPG
jgi:hypothetical protein